MASVASQLIAEVTAHAQSDSLEDEREIWADGTIFPNNLRASNLSAEQFVRNFDVLLTVHLSILLVINQLDAQILVL